MKAAAAPLPLFADADGELPSSKDVLGLNVAGRVLLGRSDTIVYVADDSVVKFTGDAIVNAANEGCLGGGGIDGEVNRRGGVDLRMAREALPLIDHSRRCETGDAKITVAGDLPCDKVIHAVGPRFSDGPGADHEGDLDLLESAYKSSLERACENSLTSVAFCIISAGIYRGSCPLRTVIEKGLESIAKHVYPGLKCVVLCGFTPEEQTVLKTILQDIKDGRV